MPKTTYSVCNLAIDSEIPLPELLATEDAPQITLRLAQIEPPPEHPHYITYRPIAPGEVIVHYRDVGTARVKDGNTILLDPDPKADALTIRLFVLQQVLGVILLQRGYFVLHASAAVIHGRAVAFAGISGQGKSTMTAALNHIGHPVLSDDVLAIDLSGDKPIALPGLLQLKLTEETRAQVAPDILAEQTIGDAAAKKLCAVRGATVRGGVPLDSIYLLGRGPTVEFSEIQPAQAAVLLVPQTYGSRLVGAIGLAEKHFHQCARLVREVSVMRLLRPRDMSLIGDIANQVIARVKQPLRS